VTANTRNWLIGDLVQVSPSLLKNNQTSKRIVYTGAEQVGLTAGLELAAIRLLL